jgi:hypothetical protein
MSASQTAPPVGIVVNTALLINLALAFIICIVTLLILKWVVSYALWKWQDVIDERARTQYEAHYGRKQEERQEEEEEEPRTHYTAKTTRRRK